MVLFKSRLDRLVYGNLSSSPSRSRSAFLKPENTIDLYPATGQLRCFSLPSAKDFQFSTLWALFYTICRALKK